MLTSIKLSRQFNLRKLRPNLIKNPAVKIWFLKLSNDAAFGTDVKSEVLLQLFNKSKLRNETKTFREPNFFFVYNQI